MSALHEITDISRHLDEQVKDVVMDKMKLLQVCGYTPIVGSAVALAATLSLMKLSIGMWLTQLPDDKRAGALEDTLLKLIDDVRKGAPGLLAAVRDTEAKRA